MKGFSGGMTFTHFCLAAKYIKSCSSEAREARLNPISKRRRPRNQQRSEMISNGLGGKKSLLCSSIRCYVEPQRN